MMENKNIFLGVDLAGDDLAVLCIIVNNETFYFEFNDCDLTKANTKLLNKMIFLNSEEKSLCYKSGEKGVTFIRDNKDIIREHVENIIRQYCDNSRVSFIGNIKPLEFVKFYNLIKGVTDLEHINIDDYYVSLNSIETALNVLRITDDNIFGLKESENDNNRIVTTALVKNLYEGLKLFRPKE